MSSDLFIGKTKIQLHFNGIRIVYDQFKGFGSYWMARYYVI